MHELILRLSISLICLPQHNFPSKLEHGMTSFVLAVVPFKYTKILVSPGNSPHVLHCNVTLYGSAADMLRSLRYACPRPALRLRLRRCRAWKARPSECRPLPRSASCRSCFTPFPASCVPQNISQAIFQRCLKNPLNIPERPELNDQ